MHYTPDCAPSGERRTIRGTPDPFLHSLYRADFDLPVIERAAEIPADRGPLHRPGRGLLAPAQAGRDRGARRCKQAQTSRTRSRSTTPAQRRGDRPTREALRAASHAGNRTVSVRLCRLPGWVVSCNPHSSAAMTRVGWADVFRGAVLVTVTVSDRCAHVGCALAACQRLVSLHRVWVLSVAGRRCRRCYGGSLTGRRVMNTYSWLWSVIGS